MNSAIGVRLDNSVTPLLAEDSLLSYHILPNFLIIVILAPGATGSVNLIYGVVPLTENSASTISSADGLLAPLDSTYISKGFLRNRLPETNTST